jgi:hypothetical protein
MPHPHAVYSEVPTPEEVAEIRAALADLDPAKEARRRHGRPSEDGGKRFWLHRPPAEPRTDAEAAARAVRDYKRAIRSIGRKGMAMPTRDEDLITRPGGALGCCPDCGRPYGTRRRCYRCRPTHPHVGEVSTSAPPHPRVEPRPPLRQDRGAVPAKAEMAPAVRPTGIEADLAAMRAVAAALAGLDRPARVRVLEAMLALTRGTP